MRKICVIDDDHMYQVIIKRLIMKIDADAKLMTFKNGADALDGFKTLLANDPLLCDVILLDINMPLMDGWQFLHAIENILPGIGNSIDIYVVSTSLDGRDKEKALADKNVKGYISKPIPTEILTRIVLGKDKEENL